MRSLIRVSLIFLTLTGFGQVLQTSQPFSSASAFLEPDGRKNLVKISDEEFVLISKVKGGMNGESSFTLEKFDKNLSQKFKTPLICPSDENYKELYYNGKDLILLSIRHNEASKTSKLLAYGFDIVNGTKKWDKVLAEQTIKDWTDAIGKATVKSTFQNEICSVIPKTFVTPFEYQFEVKFSPDRKTLFTYIFDYSQKTLIAHCALFDADLNPKSNGIIPIDNGFMNYGIFPNNRGDVFILNGDRGGRVSINQYNLEKRSYKLLDIQSSSSSRNSLTLQVLNDDAIYMACINLGSQGEMKGIMYTKFDFKQMLVDKINVQEITQNISQTAESARSDFKGITAAEENWKNYEIVSLLVNEFEKIIIILEKRELTGVGYIYNPNNFNQPANWTERPLRVNTEAILMYSFNKDDEMLWENYHMKSQNNDATSGLTTSSFSFDLTDDGRIRVFYPSSDNSTGVYNTITYIEWDELSGFRTKELKTPNEGALSMITEYTMWWQDRAVVVGRKGMLGKKSYISLYKLELD